VRHHRLGHRLGHRRLQGHRPRGEQQEVIRHVHTVIGG
jgi:hypothetical protein